MTNKEIKEKLEFCIDKMFNHQKRIVELENKIKELEQLALVEYEDFSQNEFKVGDRVQFKSWDEMEEEFGLTKWGGINNPAVSFSVDMKYLCETYATIKEVDGNFVLLEDFSVENDDNIEWTYALNMLKPAINEPRWTFTDDEKVILRNLPKKYRWISRDEDGELFVYENNPRKEKGFKHWKGDGYYLTIFGSLFQSIKWADEQPCEFRKYLGGLNERDFV